MFPISRFTLELTEKTRSPHMLYHSQPRARN